MPRKTRYFDGFVPEPGFEEHWQRHIVALEQLEKAEHERDKIKVESSSDKNWPKFLEAQNAVDKAISTTFGTYDAYAVAVKRKAKQVGVPEEELRAIIGDSLSDKLDELDFTINFGMLGSKVAQAIRELTAENDPVEMPLCEDCG